MSYECDNDNHDIGCQCPGIPGPTHVDLTGHGQVNRVELIDHRASSGKPGRVFGASDVDSFVLSIQDSGRTLKLFIS